MNDLVPLKASLPAGHPRYEDARYQAIACASSAVRRLAATIDYLHETELGHQKIYLQYVEAYGMRVVSDAMNHGQARHHGLAYLEQDILMTEKLGRKLVDMKGRLRDPDNNIDKEMALVREDAAALEHFFTAYKADIEKERRDPEYLKGRTIVDGAVSALESASKGVWHSEFVSVQVETTGKRQNLETPASACLARVARLARTQQARLEPGSS